MYSMLVLTNNGQCFLTEKAKQGSLHFPLNIHCIDHDLTLDANEVALYFIKNNQTQSIKAWSKDDDKLVCSDDSEVANKFSRIINNAKRFSKVGA